MGWSNLRSLFDSCCASLYRLLNCGRPCTFFIGLRRASIASTEYFTITGRYWVRSCEFLVGIYWPKLESDSDFLVSLAVLLLGLETELFKIVVNYLQLLECIID